MGQPGPGVYEGTVRERAYRASATSPSVRSGALASTAIVGVGGGGIESLTCAAASAVASSSSNVMTAAVRIGGWPVAIVVDGPLPTMHERPRHVRDFAIVIPYPLFFEPILKAKVWGGRRLAALGKDLPDDTPIGESWELADLPDSIPGGRSIVVNGPLAGRTLHECIGDLGDDLMGPVTVSDEGGFPLLIKLLDARENLSVQVHPDADYAARHPGAHVKSEAWIVLAADPGALIYKGVQPEVTPQVFTRHVADGSVVDDLVSVPAVAGDCHYLPSGTCHALGAGIVVAEVQTPSDTTFRVYDWGREGRDLHLEAALECIAFGEPPRGPDPPGVPIEVDGLRTTPLVATPDFRLERIETARGAELSVETSGQPEVWMGLTGITRLDAQGVAPVGLRAGSTTLLPAALRAPVARLEAGTALLRIRLPTPIDGLMA